MVVAKAEATAGCLGPPNPAISRTPESTTRAPPLEEPPRGTGWPLCAPRVSAPVREKGPPPPHVSAAVAGPGGERRAPTWK